MGLDTSHNCWRGSYSAFSRWRQKIAETAGYAVLEVKHGDGLTLPTIMLDWGHVTNDNLMGEWDEIPSDPLVIIFAHSDCEGIIKWQHAAAIADALEDIISELPTKKELGHIGDWREKTQAFIDGLRKAAAAMEDVEFH